MQRGAFLASTAFALALRLFVLEASVVHHPGDGRAGVGRDLDQVQALRTGEVERLHGRHDAELFALGADGADFANANRFVDALFSVFSLILDGQRNSPLLRAGVGVALLAPMVGG